MLLVQELTEILPEKKNHGLGNGYCAENHEYIIEQDLGLRAFKRQIGQCLTIVLKENRKRKINQSIN